MSIDHNPRKSPFEISELAEFDQNISNDPPDDQRRKRLAYLSQAMSQMGLGKSIFKVAGCFILPFAIIPLFWPFLLFFYVVRKKALQSIEEQYDDALRYWGIDRYELDRHD